MALSIHSFGSAQGLRENLDPQQKLIHQSLRIAFFVESLELTPDESTQFWPIWNEIESTLHISLEAMKEKERLIVECKSDEAAHELMQEVQALQLEILNQKFDGYQRVASIIGERRAALIPQIERKFRAQMMRKMGGQKNSTNRPHGGFKGRPGRQ